MDRYGLYERLSRITEASTSIDRQDTACRAEVSRRGGTVVGVFKDEGVSGALPPMDRPGMKRLLQSLTGVDVVMVWKIDRIARSFIGFAEIVKELDSHGVSLVSATEPIDMTGPTGRAMAQMIAIFAELEREMIKARVADSMRKAKEDNRFHGGRIPYGLTVADHPSGRGRILVRDPHAVGVLREVLLWVLEGVTLTECARRLNERGEATSRQRGAVMKGTAKAREASWRQPTLRRILTSPTMRGYRVGKDGEAITDDYGLPLLAWDPVFQPDEWDALQSALETQQQTHRAPAASHWLSGVARCEECGGNLKQHVTGSGSRSFTCRGPEERRHKPGVYVNLPSLADWVRKEFPRRYGWMSEVSRVWVPGSDATRELNEVKRALQRLRDDRDAGLFDDEEDEYRDRVQRLSTRRKALQGVPLVEPHWDTQETGRSLGELWGVLNDEKRGALLREYELHVWVKTSPTRTTPVGERAYFAPADPEREALEAILREEEAV